jgi:hypothetical protein
MKKMMSFIEKNTERKKQEQQVLKAGNCKRDDKRNKGFKVNDK